MDLTLFELTIERLGSDGPSGRGASDGGRRSDGGGRGTSGRELDVRVSDEPPEEESQGPSWGTVAKVALATAAVTTAATFLAVWYLRRGKGEDGGRDRVGGAAPEMGSVSGESASGGSTSGESASGKSSGSRVPFGG